MKTDILRFAFFAIVLSSLPAIDLDAQTIIDTNYYRYAYSPFKHEYWSPVWAYDEVTEGYGIGYVIDSVSMCVKDELGYLDIRSVEIHTDRHSYGYGAWEVWHFPEMLHYRYLPLPHGNMDIYGIAVFLDSIKEFQPGDYLTMYACKKSDDGTHMEIIDSVVLNEHTMGVKRFMRCPINDESIYGVIYDTNHYPIPFDYCIDHDELAQVMEVYFEHPVHIADSQLFWHFKLHDNSARFFFSFRSVLWNMDVYNYDCSYWGATALSYDYMMAITEPLPQWEQDRMELLITDVVEDPDPEDPEDPDDPGGDEGIDNFEIQNTNFEINIYPNPSSGVTTVSCEEAITELTVRDMAGRVVVHRTACGTTATFDTSTLRKGVYLVKVTTARGTATKKLVVE